MRMIKANGLSPVQVEKLRYNYNLSFIFGTWTYWYLPVLDKDGRQAANVTRMKIYMFFPQEI